MTSLKREISPPPPVQGITTGFRLVSYNMLAKAYTRPAQYSHSPFGCLNWRNRSQATLTLLRDLRSDFLCLQELDMYGFYRQNLKKDDYSSVYIRRTGQKPDGCGIFYKHNVAKLLIKQTIKYNDLAKSVYADKVYEENYLQRDCVGIMAAFRLKGAPFNQVVIVANTHLFWNPSWSNVKFAQAKYLTKRLAEFKTLVSKRFRCEEPFVIVAGDFNAKPNSKVYQYLVSGCPGHQSWIANNEVVAYFQELALEEPPMPLCSVYALANGREPKFTNCKPNFKETLDYIFFSPSRHIKLVSVDPLPESSESPDVVSGLPNFYHPSDHLPIAADFEIIKE
ncbi:hypothetical protein ACOSQ3_031249 [Xanthoceras sorbifolium]